MPASFVLVFVFPLIKYPEVKLLCHMVALFLFFLRILHTVFCGGKESDTTERLLHFYRSKVNSVVVIFPAVEM